MRYPFRRGFPKPVHDGDAQPLLGNGMRVDDAHAGRVEPVQRGEEIHRRLVEIPFFWHNVVALIGGWSMYKIPVQCPVLVLCSTQKANLFRRPNETEIANENGDTYAAFGFNTLPQKWNFSPHSICALRPDGLKSAYTLVSSPCETRVRLVQRPVGVVCAITMEVTDATNTPD